MKIDRISCSQFAGLRDRELNLHEGLNVICGPNESGKSSMVNLLSRVLFQSSRLDGRRDRDFKKDYFPVQREDSSFCADFIDGEVKFHAGQDSYRLRRQWGEEPGASLVTPEGMVRSESSISSILRELLCYGEGVYRDMLFSSQKNAAETLRTLLSASENSEAKKEVAQAAAGAFSESEGISADAIGEAIQKKIDGIAGKHWDLERQQPVKRAARWSAGIGEIHRAFYKLEDAAAVQDNIEKLELKAEAASALLSLRQQQAEQAKAEYERFVSFSSALAARSGRRKLSAKLEEELRKLERDLQSWPEAERDRDKAAILSDELKKRRLLDKLAAAGEIKAELDKIDPSLLKAECPDRAVIVELKAARRRIEKLENKLCGMNLSAAVSLSGGYEMEITSLRTGEKISLDEKGTAISEAVRIRIPGVMEMELSPADVNADELARSIESEKRTLGPVLEKYQVSSVEALEALQNRISSAVSSAERLKERLTLVLDGEDYESLSAEAGRLEGDIPAEREITARLAGLCGRESAERYIAGREARIKDFISDYGSIEELRARCAETSEELEKAGAAQEAESIPPEYEGIAEPEEKLKALKAGYEDRYRSMEEAMREKSGAEKELEVYTGQLSSDPAEAVARAGADFEEQKELLTHWLNIQRVFLRQKEELNDRPLEGLAERFTFNLRHISGGRLTSRFEDRDRLSPGIYSDRRPMDYEKLSEGTKESVSLAFRLAVLDQLFPEGGGIAVFDDPFTDMDSGRMQRAAELIKESAGRHQIIFLTCREEYAALMSREFIRI